MATGSQSIESKILRSIRAQSSARAVSAKDFARLGAPATISQSLGRLTRAGHLRRVRRGYYDRPRQHPLLGQTAPDPLAMITSMMANTSAQWQPSGAYAANLLGLSEQVPAKIVILTDGAPRKVNLGKLVLDFRRTAPRNLLGAGRPSGLAIQALRHFRKDLNPRRIAQLRRHLDDSAKHDLKRLAPQLPAWMQEPVRQLLA